jgi:predicted ATPase
VSENLLAAVHARAGGNAFYSIELLRALPAVDDRQRSVRGPGSSSIDALVPATVSDAIEERAARLSPTARAALDWATVLPERFTFLELAAVGGEELGVAPEGLADAGFVVDDGEGHWSFAHAIIHDAVYRRLPEAERVRRHGVVADALAEMPLERLAPQLERAHRFRDAAAAYLELAQRSLKRGHGADAGRLYRRSGSLARVAGDGPLRRRAEGGRVLSLVRAGASDEAWRAAAVVRADARGR